MIRDNQRYLNILHIVLDGVLVAAAYMLAWWIRFESVFTVWRPVIGTAFPMWYYFSALYYLVPSYLALYFFNALYTPRRVTRFRHEFFGVFKANVAGLIGFFVVLYVIKQPDFSRAMIFIFFVLNILFSVIFRWLVRKVLRAMRKRDRNLKHVLLIGYSRSAENYIARVHDNPEWGYVINGVLDDYVPLGTKYRGIQVVGRLEELEQQLEDNRYDEIIITLSLDHYDRLEEFVAICEKSGVHTKFIPDYTSLIPSNPYTEDVQGLPVISIRYVPLTGFFNRLVKRLTDIIGAILAIILFSPAMLFAVIAVRLSGKGPVIFKQERVGLHGKPFMMYKFRTMQVQEEGEEKKAWTTRNDPRVTGIGRFLRATSIDEMPQFFNVLAGKMSLVGPRPERPQFVEKFKEQIPRYMIKHQVRPGITGWAQVNGYRGDTSIRKRIEYDIYYIENWTYGFDLRILFSTIFHGFISKNAY
ncbi:MAG: undecaprenyl-phosphate glucose phosphotransferase [Lachnospiraceae bacterium]|nr:undecaprenyl-phosphate glucose phosphotransferase [Lachnospiraceae bacterium]